MHGDGPASLRRTRNITAGRTEFVYTRPMVACRRRLASDPQCLPIIIADLDIPEGGAEGITSPRVAALAATSE